MKKLFTIIVAFIFALLITSCNEPGEEINQEKINNVITMIDSLPNTANIEIEDEALVINARNAYNELTDNEKTKITNITKLNNLEAKLERLFKNADEDLIIEIEDLINQLPSIDELTVNNRSNIDKIDELISKLRILSKNNVSNILKYDIAKDQVIFLENEEVVKKQAKEVIDMINSLPNINDITLNHLETVEGIRAKYDSISKDAQNRVTNYKTLVEIEYVINTLKEFQNFDPRDVLKCIPDVATSNTCDLIITEGDNFKVEWESSNEKLFYFEDGYAKVSKVYQTHRKQNVTVTATITLSNNEKIVLTKLITVNPVLFSDLPSTPVATYFQSSALSNYTKYSDRYLEEGTLFSEKAKEVLDIVYYAFANLDEAGNITLANYDILNDLRALKANDVRIVMCIAGVSSTGSKYFTAITKDDAKRAKFINNIVKTVETYNFDGVDIDWESTSDYPVVATSMNKLMRELRSKLDESQDPDGSKYLLSAAIPASSWGAGSDRFDFATLNKYVDYVNMMSYDMNKTTNATHLSPLYKSSYDGGYGFGVDYGVQLFTSRGLDKNKIIIGSAGYGKSYKVNATVISEKYPGLSASASLTHLNGVPGAHASGTLFLNAVTRLLKTGQYIKYIEYNTSGQIVGSFLFNKHANIFVTYDSEEIIAAKYQYAKANEGMGIMCWAYTEDTADNYINSIYDEIHK